MQHLSLGAAGLKKYHDHLQTSHDFEVWADVLTMEEVLVSQVDILDGQVNFNRQPDSPHRTASLLISDPGGALQYGNSFTRDGENVMWVNRLLRIRHRVDVPTLGPVTTTVMVGSPTSAQRSGGEISMELADKQILLDHGVRPRTFKKGMRADNAVRQILREIGGERHLRIPQPSRKIKLSKPYTVGMGDDSLTPWQAAKRIARNELGCVLYYSADGYATMEPVNARRAGVEVHHLLSLPSSGTTFTDFSNYAKATSVRQITNKAKGGKKVSRTVRFNSVATLPAKHDLSEQSLARHGARRTLPIVVLDDSLKTQRRVNRRAREELEAGSEITVDRAYEIPPFFHLDMRDFFILPLGIGRVAFDSASIPLGAGGAMTLGQTKWVSRPVKVKRVRASSKVLRKKKGKGGQKNG